MSLCPHARLIEGSAPGESGVVCGVMERDAARADSILEGAPVGVFIKLAEDPSTIVNLCCGTGQPLLSPDDLVKRAWGEGHYTGCPIFAADRELSALERTFPFDRPEPTTPPIDLERDMAVSMEDPEKAAAWVMDEED